MSRINNIKLLTIILFLHLSLLVFAQNIVVDPVFTSNPRNFNGRVSCIFQDKTGFIWIGKPTGLFRFDGYELKSYKSNASDTNTISNDNILSISEDSSGYLWVGTKGGGLNRYDRETGKFKRFLSDELNPGSISYDEVYSIFPATNDNMWIGTDGGGFNYYNSKLQTFKTFRQDINNNIGLRSNKILCFAKNGPSNLWLGTWSGGLHLFDTITKKITHFGEGTPFSSINIFYIKEVNPGILWLATWGQGLIAFDINKNIFSTIIKPSEILNFYCIQTSISGKIWLGSGSGLVFFSSPTSDYKILEDPITKSGSLICLCEDNTGTIWFGTERGTVGKINLHQKKFSQIPPSLPITGLPVNTILPTRIKDQVYFSLQNKLIRYNTNTNLYKAFQCLYSDLVSMAYVPGTNFILCGSSQGISLFDQRKEKFSKLLTSSQDDSDILKKQVFTIFIRDSASFWIGALGCAYVINREIKTGHWKLGKVYYTDSKESLSTSHFPSSFQEDKKGNFWIGTWGGGLDFYSPVTKKFSVKLHDPVDPGTISDNFVECLIKIHDSVLFVGTHMGIDLLNSDYRSFSHITVNDGLANNWITAMIIDQKNRIWLSTHGGISNISEDLNEIRNFDSEDGLPSNSFLPRSAMMDSEGILYFGSERGLVWFHPDSIRQNSFLPEIVITDFRVNYDTVKVSEASPLHHNIEVTNDIILNYRQSTFSLQITPLSYFNPKKNKIKYILTGYDKTWKVAGADRIARYTNIPPGKYVFSVIASNEDGIWNMKGNNIRITIKKPLWLTGRSIALYVLVLITLAILVFYRLKVSNKVDRSGDSGKKINQDLINPSEIYIEPAEMQFIHKALKVVEDNLANPDFGVDEMCLKMSISRSQLYRKINSATGLSISEFIKEIRLKRAAQLLKQNPDSISGIAYSIGFNDAKYFSKCFKHKFGVSPAQFIQNNEQSLPPQ